MRKLSPSEKAHFQAIANKATTPRQIIMKLVKDSIVDNFGGKYVLTDLEQQMLQHNFFMRSTVNRVINHKKKILSECRKQ